MWGFIGKKCEDCGGRHIFWDEHLHSCAKRSARLMKETEEIMKKDLAKRRLTAPSIMTLSAMSLSTSRTSDISRRKRRDEDDQRRRDDDDDHRSSFSSSSGGDSDFGGSSSGFGGGDSGGGGSSSDF